MSLLPEARRLLAALGASRGVQAEIFLSEGRSRDVAWGEGKAKDVLGGWSRGVSVRVVEDGRQGFASSNDVSAESARALFEKARAAAALMPADKHRALPRPAAAPAFRVKPDPSIFASSVKSLQSRLRSHEKNILGADRRVKKAIALSYGEDAGARAVVNTWGLAAEGRSAAVSFSLELLGADGGETQAAWDGVECLSWRRLPEERVLSATVERLLFSFGATPLKTGVYPVIFPPRAGAEILDATAPVLSGESVLKKKSFWAEKIGRRVASPLVTLVDDGRLPGGTASSRFDDEGLPARKNVLLRAGVLRGFYHDGYSAARAGAKSTGNAGRAGPQSAPAPAPTNFYMFPGRRSRKALFSSTPRALIVEDVLGLHTADPVSGDFSVGVSGRLWEGGKVSRGVKGVTVAGNLADLFQKIDAVADDLTWRGATGCPTFRVSGLSVGGE